jgi:hypothetical protein
MKHAPSAGGGGVPKPQAAPTQVDEQCSYCFVMSLFAAVICWKGRRFDQHTQYVLIHATWTHMHVAGNWYPAVLWHLLTAYLLYDLLSSTADGCNYFDIDR